MPKLRGKAAPSLLEAIADERGRHFFVDTRTCRCGFKPADGGEWIRHGQAAVIIGLAQWMKDAAAAGKGAASWPARLIFEAVANTIRKRLIRELWKRDQGEERPWTTGSRSR